MNRIDTIASVLILCAPMMAQAESSGVPAHRCAGPACVPSTNPFTSPDAMIGYGDPFYMSEKRRVPIADPGTWMEQDGADNAPGAHDGRNPRDVATHPETFKRR